MQSRTSPMLNGLAASSPLASAPPMLKPLTPCDGLCRVASMFERVGSGRSASHSWAKIRSAIYRSRNFEDDQSRAFATVSARRMRAPLN
jgi:hypothetical protein